MIRGTLQSAGPAQLPQGIKAALLVAALAGGALTWAPGVAHAQNAPPQPATAIAVGEAAASQYPECTRTPTDADVEGAKGAHKAATQFFERGDYDRALQYWRDAYGFDCSRPPLLLNIGSAYEKKGDRAATISVLELFLSRAKDSPDAPTVREKIANLRAALEAEKAAAAPPPVAPPPVVGPVTAPPEGETERPYGITPWIVVGAGGGVALIGVVPLVMGIGKVADAENICPDRASCNDQNAIDQGNSGRTLSLVGQIMIPVGLVAAGGGLVWQLVFNEPQPVADSASAARATVVPAVGPGFQGAVLTGAF